MKFLFTAASFGMDASFADGTFERNARFDDAAFRGNVKFDGANSQVTPILMTHISPETLA